LSQQTNINFEMTVSNLLQWARSPHDAGWN